MSDHLKVGMQGEQRKPAIIAEDALSFLLSVCSVFSFSVPFLLALAAQVPTQRLSVFCRYLLQTQERDPKKLVST